MSKGLVDLAKYQREIDIKIDNNDFTLAGCQGFCFIEGNEMVKIYRLPNMNKSFFDGYKSKFIAFPDYYIRDENNTEILGEVMPYFEAINIEKSLTLESSVDLLICHYKNIRKEIKNYSNIHMYDLSYLNMLYNENSGLYLIDTTSWYLDKDTANHYRKNLFYLDRALFEDIYNLITDNTYARSLLEIKNNYQGIKSFPLGRTFLKLLEINLLEHDYHFLELMDVYKEIVQIYYNDEIKLVEDVKKYAKIMKNS